MTPAERRLTIELLALVLAIGLALGVGLAAVCTE